MYILQIFPENSCTITYTEMKKKIKQKEHEQVDKNDIPI